MVVLGDWPQVYDENDDTFRRQSFEKYVPNEKEWQFLKIKYFSKYEKYQTNY